MNDRLIVLLGALAFDVLFGEPPSGVHPVVWMGRYIGWGDRHAPLTRPLGMFLYGTALIALGLGTVVAAASGIGLLLEALPRTIAMPPAAPGDSVAGIFPTMLHGLGLLVGAWLLKTTFAGRALVRAARGVQDTLERGDVPEARRLLSWHLVSRDTSALDAALVAAATVESVAENFSDSLVAPLLFFALFGVPGALAYRFANTADAMLGCRDARREYLGKFAARLDDVLNLVPARLSALLLLAGAGLAGRQARVQVVADVRPSTGWSCASKPRHRHVADVRPSTGWPCASKPRHRHVADVRPSTGWRVMWRDHARTPSPNAGWPMSVMAGILGVTLEKVGHYRLGDGAAPDAHDIGRSLRVATASAMLWVVLVASAICWT